MRHLSVPNLITSMSALLGISGLMLINQGHLKAAITCGIVAITCDMLDGWAARKLNLTSSFGADLDSLADATSFCVLPAVLAASVGGTLVAPFGCAFALAGLWRLAHFSESGLIQWRGRPAFTGMPTPYAAAVLLLVTISHVLLPQRGASLGLAILCALLALYMLSARPFAKGGWHYRALWILLPLAGLMLWRHPLPFA